MIQFYELILKLLRSIREQKQLMDGHLPTDAISEAQKALVAPVLTRFWENCTRLEIREGALARIARINVALANKTDPCTFGYVSQQLQTLQEAIEDDLRLRFFWYVPAEQENFFKGVLAAGDIPFKEGPDREQVQFEWRQAAQCYALECNTACVMHLMRLMELGLRALAKHMDATEELKPPIELANWKPVLDAIGKRIEKLKEDPRSTDRAREIAFYSDAAERISYFQGMRDESAHARARYDKYAARSTLDRVKEFMTLLAEKLSSA